mgnify:FL=1
MSKATKAAATETVMSRIAARASKDSGNNIQRLGDRPLEAVEVTSTGSLSLDAGLGVGGWPRGRIVELYGQEATGKTTLVLHSIIAAQKAGLGVAFIDAEHALDTKYARHLGVNVDDLYVAQPMTAEEALDLVCNLCDSSLIERREIEARAKDEKTAPDFTGMLGLIILDSVAALVPKAELEGEMGDAHVALVARMMGKAMRKMTPSAHHANVTIICINQQRMKINAGHGSPWTTTGGNALKFYASVRVQLSNIGQIKGNGATADEKMGNRVKANIQKNKVAAPFIEVEYDLMKGEGIDRAGEVIDLAVDHGILKAKGSWLYRGDKTFAQGRPAGKTMLAAKPEVMAELEAAVRESVETYGMKGPPKVKGKKPVDDADGEDGVAA